MSYILNRTDGTILTELVDGVIDSDTTDISLVGRNFTGYGEFINENFIQMLENFANTTVPLSPLRGQLWYDTNINKLKIYDGNEFLPASGSFVSLTVPQGPIAGDTWFNTSSNQLFLYDGDEFQLIGPQFTLQQGESGAFVRTVQDTNLNSRTVLEIRVGTVLQAVISQNTIVPNNSAGNIISELVTNDNPTGTIFPGYNIVNSYDFVYQGTSTRAQNLIVGKDEATEFSTDKVLRNDIDGSILGSLTLRGNVDSGSDPELILGAQEASVGLKENSTLVTNELMLSTNVVNNNIRLVVTRDVGGNNTLTDAVTIRAQDRFVGIFTPDPSYTLDVDGDTRITGDLIVEGTTTTIESTTVAVADKNIELGIVPDDSSDPTNITADGGGITLKGGADGDKTINWVNATNSWTLSENVDLAVTKDYNIDGTMVLNSTSLGMGITDAPGLVRVGNLDDVTAADIKIGVDAPGTISKLSTPGLVINANITGVDGTINVSDSKITFVGTPDVATDAANKLYVDQEIDNSLIVFSMDITGWATNVVDSNVILYLNQLFSPTTANNDKLARIITTRITSDDITGINVEAQSTVTYGEVLVSSADPITDFSDITRLTVVQDVSLPTNLSVPYTPTIERITRKYRVTGGVWVPDGVEPTPTGLQ